MILHAANYLDQRLIDERRILYIYIINDNFFVTLEYRSTKVIVKVSFYEQKKNNACLKR